jgi:hypothetical protein
MADRQQILNSPAFREFIERIQKKITESQPDAANLEAGLLSERAQLDRQCQGWRQSLSNPALSPIIRSTLETDWGQAMERITAIDVRITELQSSATNQREVLNPEMVAERLENLGEILADGNASATNLVLAQHIAGIYCDSEGKIVVRLCQLGALGNPQQFGNIDGPTCQDDTVSESTPQSHGRRRTRRNVPSEVHDDEEAMDAANDFAVDPARFAGLGPEWFTDDVFHVPVLVFWADDNAVKVAEYRLRTNASMDETAAYFKKSVPTIRKALRNALETHGINALGKGVSAPTRAYWPRDNAEAVAEFFSRPKATMKAAQEHFGKSQPWISKARKIAREESSPGPSDSDSNETDVSDSTE